MSSPILIVVMQTARFNISFCINDSFPTPFIISIPICNSELIFSKMILSLRYIQFHFLSNFDHILLCNRAVNNVHRQAKNFLQFTADAA